MFSLSSQEIIGWILGTIGTIIFLTCCIKWTGWKATIIVLFKTAGIIIWIAISLYLIMEG